MPQPAEAQQFCFPLASYPMAVQFCYDDSDYVRTEQTEFGPQDVYLISQIKYTNFTGIPWRIWAQDSVNPEYEFVVGAAGDGERNIPAAFRFESFPLSVKFTNVSYIP